MMQAGVNTVSSGAAQSASGVHHHHHGGMRQQGMQDLAKALNMSQSDLSQALGSGKSVADLAQQQGVSMDSLKSTLTQDAQQRLSQDLQSGKISQTQYNNLSQRAQSFADRLLQQGGTPQTSSPSPSAGTSGLSA